MEKTPESNLNRLKKSKLPKTFVEQHNGLWDHSDWLEFCLLIEEKGYTPIDIDQVGLCLEELKKEFWQKKNEENAPGNIRK